MSNIPRDEGIARLRSKLDELATALLVSGPGNVAGALPALERQAQRCGAFRIAELAATAVEELSASNSAWSSEGLLRDAFLQMQRNLDEAAPEGSNDKAPAANPLADDPELVGDFVTESREHLAAIENGMLTLDQNPSDVEAVHAVFRGFHTIKGLAGFLDLTPIRDVAHHVENLLDLARNGKLQITATVVDAVLASVDYLKQAIHSVELSLGSENRQRFRDSRSLIHSIQSIVGSESGEAPATELESLAGAISSAQASATPQNTDELRSLKQPERVALKSAEASSVRVLTSKLDYLMDMVGEMVITQSLIRHNPALSALENSKLMAELSQLGRITGEVQRTTMGMRMIPIGQVFQRSARLVRDLSRKAGKQVQLEITGEDTELDKTIAEELNDPLLHMVRNACDHGIEEPAARTASGKDPVARIRLAAYHQGGQIVIEIADDGCGLDRDKILAKALQNRLVEPEANLSEQEIFSLIFEPGFSTAAQITDISGRGVGMDVVRKNIQKLRGRIEIQSRTGHGTTFFLKLPLTLAIIEGLIVAVGVHRYVIPIYGVRELIRPTTETTSTVHGRSEMAIVRDRVLPIVRLSRRFGVEPKSENATDGLLVVTEIQDQVFCVLVDEVLGKQEVVIKSLGEALKDIPGIAGAAILGDGRVGLILDLEGIFRR